jgi:predicted HTH domain antitoxin
MSQVTLLLPDEVLIALKLNPAQLSEEVRLAAAIKLYEMGRLSSGAASLLAGVPRTVFLSKLADYGVHTFRMNEEELKQDVARA